MQLLKKNKFNYTVLLFVSVSFIVITAMSCCSFLYPISLSRDTNIMMDGGRYLLSGKVLYRDFFEQKGIFAYVIYALAWLIAPHSFRGIYFLELICASLYYYWTYRTISALNPENKTENIWITLIACTSGYVSHHFALGGELEEFFMPFYAYLLFLAVNYSHNDVKISNRSYLFVGIFSGIIFWSKYLCLALPLSVMLYHLLISLKKSDSDSAARMINSGFIGFVGVTIPVILYFLLTHSFGDMVSVYFRENIFGYIEKQETIIGRILQTGIFAFTAIGYSLFYCVYWFALIFIRIDVQKNKDTKYRDIALMLLFCFCMTLLFISLAGTGWSYYFLPMVVFYPLILFFVTGFFNKYRNTVMFLFVIPILLMAAYFGEKSTILKENYQNLCSAVDIIQQSGSRKIILLDFMDNGYYLLLDYLPDRYYFAPVNARHDIIVEEYKEDLRQQAADFVIIENSVLQEENEQFLKDCGYESCFLSENGEFIEMFRLTSGQT